MNINYHESTDKPTEKGVLPMHPEAVKERLNKIKELITQHSQYYDIKIVGEEMAIFPKDKELAALKVDKESGILIPSKSTIVTTKDGKRELYSKEHHNSALYSVYDMEDYFEAVKRRSES